MAVLTTPLAYPEPFAFNSKRTARLERAWGAVHLALLLATAWLAWTWAPNTPPKNLWKTSFEQSSSLPVSQHSSTRPSSTRIKYVAASSSLTASSAPQDSGLSEVWELSSRHLPEKFCRINPLDPGLKAQRHTAEGWQPDQLENALIDDGRLVILYVHGNFMERCNAQQRVLILNEYLKQRANRPYKLLMLSWPSTREPHPLRDVYENAESAECQALFVGWLLERLALHHEVSLLGFSFGARAVTGGLHLASGGNIPGFCHQSVAHSGAITPSYRVALVAPAVDRDWIAAGGKHQCALENVSGLINLYNSKDPILRRFRFIDRLSRPVAAGFAGFIGLQGLDGLSDPRATSPLDNSTKIRQFDCGSGIGTTHSERSYYAQCHYFSLVLDHLLGQEPNANSTN